MKPLLASSVFAVVLTLPLAARAEWPCERPFGALSPAVPIWCQNPGPEGPANFISGPNSWVDDFDHGLHNSTMGPGYLVFERLNTINRSQHFRHNNHWMVDVNGEALDGGTGNFGGATMRPDRSFRFENGKLVVEADVATAIDEYISDSGGQLVWPEITVTNSPTVTAPTRWGAYGYNLFPNNWTVGCIFYPGRTPGCALVSDNGQPPESDEIWQASHFQRQGARHFGGEPGTPVPGTNSQRHIGDYWRRCGATDPDLNCRDRFRLELTKTSLAVYVNGTLYMEQADFPPEKQLPDALVNGEVYVYFASFIGAPHFNTARFHWDHVSVNRPNPDRTAPVISAVQATDVGPTSAVVRWTTNEPSDSQLRYGLTSELGSITNVAPALVTNHAVALTGLTPNTRYHYRVVSLDRDKNMNFTEQIVSFVTAAPSSDATPPTVAITAPANGATVSGAEVTLSATAADNVGVAGVRFTLNGAAIGVEDLTAPYSLTWDASHTNDGVHTLAAIARDTAGNTAAASISITVHNGGHGGTPGDLNGDGLVNITDLSMFLGRWNSADAQADFSGNGVVDIADLSVLLSHWTTAAPSTQSFAAPVPGNRLAAALRMIPRARRAAAEPITVDLFLDTPQPVNAVQAALTYPADKLALIGVDDSASAFHVEAREDISTPGVISLVRGSLQPLTGRLKVATLSFRADAAAELPLEEGNGGHGHSAARRSPSFAAWGAPGAPAGVYPVAFTRGSLALTADGAVNVLAKADAVDLAGRLASQTVLTPVPADGINDQIVFDADVAGLVILDVNGRKVYEAESLAGASLSWNGRDERGRLVSSGLYIAKVRKSDGGVDYQKLLVAK